MVTETHDGIPASTVYGFQPLHSGTLTPALDDTYYTVYGAQSDCMVAYFTWTQQNHIAAVRTVTPRISIDGNTLTGGTASNDSQVYYLHIQEASDVLSGTTTVTLFGSDIPIYARSIQIELKINSVADNAHIHHTCRWFNVS